MHPAFSVIFLTTLIGAAQGLYLALFSSQVYSEFELLPSIGETHFYGIGAVIALILLIAGLISSIFHLGHPERAWRSAARWKTSWLSREVIALPTMMGAVSAYGLIHVLDIDQVLFTNGDVYLSLSLFVGIFGVIATFALFLCTAMIYACIKFLQEWSNPLTVINYFLFGTASGFILATALASYLGLEHHTLFLGSWSMALTILVFITRMASLIRNNRIKYKSTIQSAIGIRHNKIKQNSQGAMGGSFNTREYFHGKTAAFLKSIKYIFIVLVFPIPLALLAFSINNGHTELLIAAFLIQYLGLVAERWFFFAQANHPQNIYYTTV
ncbi:Anaerobic dimethyl sulfoxide reductase chain C, anchor subunit [hydrothermal vent metagenome]|uniref:Anaerobic dimethyl sulfoxide reductase chain C, anchor subunit n=1 Tax=hydrothermal vent metagenome TaxID=652676 RepID=A0A3B0WWH0_9ZZZZ